MNGCIFRSSNHGWLCAVHTVRFRVCLRGSELALGVVFGVSHADILLGWFYAPTPDRFATILTGIALAAGVLESSS